MTVRGRISFHQIENTKVLALKGIKTSDVFLLANPGEKLPPELLSKETKESQKEGESSLEEIRQIENIEQKVLEIQGTVYESEKKDSPPVLSIKTFEVWKDKKHQVERSEIPQGGTEEQKGEPTHETTALGGEIVSRLSFDPEHLLKQQDFLLLSPEQVQQLKAIQGELDEVREKPQGIITHCAGEINEIIQGQIDLTEADEKRILHEVEEINEAEAALRIAAVKAHLKAWKVLTKEQRRKLQGKSEGGNHLESK